MKHIGNGSSSTCFFNGTPNKEVRDRIRQGKQKAPIYTPEAIEGMTGRYRHKPWPLKRSKPVKGNQMSAEEFAERKHQ